MTTSQSIASPDKIVSIAVGYMGAKQLFAASRIGLFAALNDGPLDAHELAAATGVSKRMARILGDSMASLGLLEREAGRYALTPDAAAYLVGQGSSVDLAPFLTFLNEISYGHWQQFDHTVDTTLPGQLSFENGRWDTFIGGVMAYNALHAKMLAAQVDFGRHQRLLDLGGLAPDFSIAAMQANPALQTTFLFDPDFIASVQAKVSGAGLATRSQFVGAKTDQARPEGAYDLVMVNHVIHRFSAEQNIEILRRARHAAAPGARLLLLDFFLDDDAKQRPLDALHAAEYLVIDGTVVYPEAEVRSWLLAAGWQVSDKLVLPGSPRVLVAEAITAGVRDYTTLSPEVAALLARGAADAPPAGPMTAQLLRTALADRFETGSELAPVARITDHPLPGGQVSLRIYHPGGAAPVPALLWLHGGGWTAGNVAENDLCCRAVCHASGAAVVSVEYRLAPEHPYPAAPNDCYAALCWLVEQGAAHGIDPQRIAVGGESAGGNLATVLCLMSRDRQGPRISGQLLVSPVYAHPDDGFDSYERYAEGFGMTAGAMRFFFDQYVSDPRHLDHPYLLPLRAADVSGLPPALLLSAEHDVLHDEGEAFVKRLEEAGVPVERTRYLGQVHGFFGLNTRLSDAARAHQRASEFLRKVFG
nr:alpha/beta hydrolase fold domain-containing protein [uncultured Roseateles sp.]